MRNIPALFVYYSLEQLNLALSQKLNPNGLPVSRQVVFSYNPSVVIPRPVMQDLADFVKLVLRIFLGVLDIEIFKSDFLRFRRVRLLRITLIGLFLHVWRKPWQPGHLSHITPFPLPCLTTSMSKWSLQTEQYWLIVFVSVPGIIISLLLRDGDLAAHGRIIGRRELHSAQFADKAPVESSVFLRPPQQLHKLDVFLVFPQKTYLLLFRHDHAPQSCADSISNRLVGETQDAVLGPVTHTISCAKLGLSHNYVKHKMRISSKKLAVENGSSNKQNIYQNSQTCKVFEETFRNNKKRFVRK